MQILSNSTLQKIHWHGQSLDFIINSYFKEKLNVLQIFSLQFVFIHQLGNKIGEEPTF